MENITLVVKPQDVIQNDPEDHRIVKSIYESKDTFLNLQTESMDMTLPGTFLLEREFHLNQVLLDHYTEQEEQTLKQRIARKYGRKEAEIQFGAGASGILHNLLRMFLSENGNIIMPYYSFEEIEKITTKCHGIIYKIFPKEDFSIHLDDFYQAINENTKVIYLSNPNIATGLSIETQSILEFAKKITVPLIIDESAIEFSDQPSLLQYSLPENVIVVRSFSKAYGFPGLRLGYLFLPKQWEQKYQKYKNLYDVSTLSIKIANTMFENSVVEKNTEKVILEREKMSDQLEASGFSMIPSTSNTLMSKEAYQDKFFEALNKEHVFVSTIENEYGKKHLKFCIQRESINQEFLNKLKKIKRSQEDQNWYQFPTSKEL